MATMTNPVKGRNASFPDSVWDHRPGNSVSHRYDAAIWNRVSEDHIPRGSLATRGKAAQV